MNIVDCNFLLYFFEQERRLINNNNAGGVEEARSWSCPRHILNSKSPQHNHSLLNVSRSSASNNDDILSDGHLQDCTIVLTESLHIYFVVVYL